MYSHSTNRLSSICLLTMLTIFLAACCPPAYHGFHLHHNGVLKSRKYIGKFSLVLLQYKHEYLNDDFYREQMESIAADTCYDIIPNSAPSMIPKGWKLNLQNGSTFYSLRSEKDTTCNQKNWTTGILKSNRTYLIKTEENRRYFREPLLIFKTDSIKHIYAVRRCWYHYSFN
jgi:hypothetical protein